MQVWGDRPPCCPLPSVLPPPSPPPLLAHSSIGPNLSVHHMGRINPVAAGELPQICVGSRVQPRRTLLKLNNSVKWRWAHKPQVSINVFLVYQRGPRLFFIHDAGPGIHYLRRSHSSSESGQPRGGRREEIPGIPLRPAPVLMATATKPPGGGREVDLKDIHPVNGASRAPLLITGFVVSSDARWHKDRGRGGAAALQDSQNEINT